MNNIQTAFDQLIADTAEVHRKFQVQAQALFKEITKEVFEKNPGITGIIWNQYTPYFNDGDSCEFRVNDATFTNAPVEELCDIHYGEYEGETEGVWSADNIRSVLERDYYLETKELILASGGVDLDSCDLFSKVILSSEMEPVMEAMFGDHVKVIATREGFEVEDCDHD